MQQKAWALPRKNKLHLRVLSALLALSFCFQEISQGAPAILQGSEVRTMQSLAGLLGDPARFQTPVEYCALQEIHKAQPVDGKNPPLIIHIQDAHANLSGQQNLAGALESIIRNYYLDSGAGEPLLVLSEGGQGDCSLTYLKEEAPAKVWQRVAKSFLMQGKLAGEEYLNLSSDLPMKIVGIEDMALYMDSLQTYAALAKNREKILTYLAQIQKAVEKLKNKLYAKELVDYEKLKLAKDARQDSLHKNFETLLEIAQNKGVDVSEFENFSELAKLIGREKEISFESANLEQAALLEAIEKKTGQGELKEVLSRFNQARRQRLSILGLLDKTFSIAQDNGINLESYPNLSRYRAYLKDFSNLDLEKVLEEFKSAEDKIYVALLPEPDARLIRSIDRYLELLETAYRIRMSSKDFEMFKINEPDFSTVAYQAFINRLLVEQGYFEDVIALENTLEEGQTFLETFYELVGQRDQAFIQNAKKALSENKQSAAVLISGGYHTQHLNALFKEMNFSYLVLTPMVTSETNQAKYEKVLLEPLESQTKTLRTVQGESRSDKSLSALEKDLIFSREKSDGLRARLLENDTGRLAELREAAGLPSLGARLADKKVSVARNLEQRSDDQVEAAISALGKLYVPWNGTDKTVAIDKKRVERLVGTIAAPMLLSGQSFQDTEENELSGLAKSLFASLSTNGYAVVILKALRDAGLLTENKLRQEVTLIVNRFNSPIPGFPGAKAEAAKKLRILLDEGLIDSTDPIRNKIEQALEQNQSTPAKREEPKIESKSKNDFSEKLRKVFGLRSPEPAPSPALSDSKERSRTGSRLAEGGMTRRRFLRFLAGAAAALAAPKLFAEDTTAVGFAQFEQYVANLKTNAEEYSQAASGEQVAKAHRYNEAFTSLYNQLKAKVDFEIKAGRSIGQDKIIRFAQEIISGSPDSKLAIDYFKTRVSRATTDREVDDALFIFESWAKKSIENGTISLAEVQPLLSQVGDIVLPRGYFVRANPRGFYDERAFVLYQSDPSRTEDRNTDQGPVRVYYVRQVTQFTNMIPLSGKLRGNVGWAPLLKDYVVVFYELSRQLDASRVIPALKEEADFQPFTGGTGQGTKKSRKWDSIYKQFIVRGLSSFSNESDRWLAEEDAIASHEADHQSRLRLLKPKEGDPYDPLNTWLDEELAVLTSMMEEEPFHIMAHTMLLVKDESPLAWSILKGVTGKTREVLIQQELEKIVSSESVEQFRGRVGRALETKKREWELLNQARLQSAGSRLADGSPEKADQTKQGDRGKRIEIVMNMIEKRLREIREQLVSPKTERIILENIPIGLTTILNSLQVYLRSENLGPEKERITNLHRQADHLLYLADNVLANASNAATNVGARLAEAYSLPEVTNELHELENEILKPNRTDKEIEELLRELMKLSDSDPYLSEQKDLMLGGALGRIFEEKRVRDLWIPMPMAAHWAGLPVRQIWLKALARYTQADEDVRALMASIAEGEDPRFMAMKEEAARYLRPMTFSPLRTQEEDREFANAGAVKPISEEMMQEAVKRLIESKKFSIEAASAIAGVYAEAIQNYFKNSHIKEEELGEILLSLVDKTNANSFKAMLAVQSILSLAAYGIMIITPAFEEWSNLLLGILAVLVPVLSTWYSIRPAPYQLFNFGLINDVSRGPLRRPVPEENINIVKRQARILAQRILPTYKVQLSKPDEPSISGGRLALRQNAGQTGGLEAQGVGAGGILDRSGIGARFGNLIRTAILISSLLFAPFTTALEVSDATFNNVKIPVSVSAVSGEDSSHFQTADFESPSRKAVSGAITEYLRSGELEAKFRREFGEDLLDRYRKALAAELGLSPSKLSKLAIDFNYFEMMRGPRFVSTFAGWELGAAARGIAQRRVENLGLILDQVWDSLDKNEFPDYVLYETTNNNRISRNEILQQALFLLWAFDPIAYSSLESANTPITEGSLPEEELGVTKGSEAKGWWGSASITVNAILDNPFVIAGVIAHEKVHAEDFPATFAGRFVRNFENIQDLLYLLGSVPHWEKESVEGEKKFWENFDIYPLVFHAPGKGYSRRELWISIGQWLLLGLILSRVPQLFYKPDRSFGRKPIRSMGAQGNRRSGARMAVSEDAVKGIVDLVGDFREEEKSIFKKYAGEVAEKTAGLYFLAHQASNLQIYDRNYRQYAEVLEKIDEKMEKSEFAGQVVPLLAQILAKYYFEADRTTNVPSRYRRQLLALKESQRRALVVGPGLEEGRDILRRMARQPKKFSGKTIHLLDRNPFITAFLNEYAEMAGVKGGVVVVEGDVLGLESQGPTAESFDTIIMTQVLHEIGRTQDGVREDLSNQEDEIDLVDPVAKNARAKLYEALLLRLSMGGNIYLQEMTTDVERVIDPLKSELEAWAARDNLEILAQYILGKDGQRVGLHVKLTKKEKLAGEGEDLGARMAGTDDLLNQAFVQSVQLLDKVDLAGPMSLNKIRQMVNRADQIEGRTTSRGEAIGTIISFIEAINRNDGEGARDYIETLREKYALNLGQAAPVVIAKMKRAIEQLQTPSISTPNRFQELNTPPQPELLSRRLGARESFIVDYESHGPLTFALLKNDRPIQVDNLPDFIRIRKQRSTGKFYWSWADLEQNSPQLNPHLVAFREYGEVTPLEVGTLQRIGNRSVLITKDSNTGTHTITLTDLNSQNGTSVILDTEVKISEDLSTQVSFDDWHQTEAIFKLLGDAMAESARSRSEIQINWMRFATLIDRWVSVDERYRAALKEHLVVALGVKEGNARASSEWLRRFFRLYHHVFYLSPSFVQSRGRSGNLLLGRIRHYTPIQWRGFRTVTYVEPIYTNARGGFKPSSNDDEVLVLLDGVSSDPDWVGLHEATHAMDILEYSQYGLLRSNANLTPEQEARMGTRGLAVYQGWELEYTAYLRTMEAIGIRKEELGLERGQNEPSLQLAEVFGGSKILDLYTGMGEDSEEHVRATRELLSKAGFAMEILKRMRQEQSLSQALEGILNNLQGGGKASAAEYKIFDQQVPGRIIRDVARLMLSSFYMRKLGYVPQYPDMTKIERLDVKIPSVEPLWQTREGLHRFMRSLEVSESNSRGQQTPFHRYYQRLYDLWDQKKADATGLIRAVGFFTQFNKRTLTSKEDVESLFQSAESLRDALRSTISAGQDDSRSDQDRLWLDVSTLLTAAIKAYKKYPERFTEAIEKLEVIPLPLVPIEPSGARLAGKAENGRRPILSKDEMSAQVGEKKWAEIKDAFRRIQRTLRTNYSKNGTEQSAREVANVAANTTALFPEIGKSSASSLELEESLARTVEESFWKALENYFEVLKQGVPVQIGETPIVVVFSGGTLKLYDEDFENSLGVFDLNTIQELTLGRGADNDVQLDVMYVQEKHARIFKVEGRWFLESVGGPVSVNNANPINSGRVLLWKESAGGRLASSEAGGGGRKAEGWPTDVKTVWELWTRIEADPRVAVVLEGERQDKYLNQPSIVSTYKVTLGSEDRYFRLQFVGYSSYDYSKPKGLAEMGILKDGHFHRGGNVDDFKFDVNLGQAQRDRDGYLPTDTLENFNRIKGWLNQKAKQGSRLASSEAEAVLAGEPSVARIVWHQFVSTKSDAFRRRVEFLVSLLGKDNAGKDVFYSAIEGFNVGNNESGQIAQRVNDLIGGIENEIPIPHPMDGVGLVRPFELTPEAEAFKSAFNALASPGTFTKEVVLSAYQNDPAKFLFVLNAYAKKLPGKPMEGTKNRFDEWAQKLTAESLRSAFVKDADAAIRLFIPFEESSFDYLKELNRRVMQGQIALDRARELFEENPRNLFEFLTLPPASGSRAASTADQHEIWRNNFERDSTQSLLAEGKPLFGFGESNPLAEELASSVPESGRILTLGCWMGGDELYFLNKGFHVTATDFISEPLDRLIRIAAEKGFADRVQTQVLETDRAIEDLRSGSFDAVYAHLSLQYLNDDDLKRRVTELRDALKPNGKIAIVMSSTSDSLFQSSMDREGMFVNKPNGERIRFVDETLLRSVFAEGWSIRVLRPDEYLHNVTGQQRKVWTLIAEKSGSRLASQILRDGQFEEARIIFEKKLKDLMHDPEFEVQVIRNYDASKIHKHLVKEWTDPKMFERWYEYIEQARLDSRSLRGIVIAYWDDMFQPFVGIHFRGEEIIYRSEGASGGYDSERKIVALNFWGNTSIRLRAFHEFSHAMIHQFGEKEDVEEKEEKREYVADLVTMHLLRRLGQNDSLKDYQENIRVRSREIYPFLTEAQKQDAEARASIIMDMVFGVRFAVESNASNILDTHSATDPLIQGAAMSDTDPTPITIGHGSRLAGLRLAEVNGARLVSEVETATDRVKSDPMTVRLLSDLYKENPDALGSRLAFFARESEANFIVSVVKRSEVREVGAGVYEHAYLTTYKLNRNGSLSAAGDLPLNEAISEEAEQSLGQDGTLVTPDLDIPSLENIELDENKRSMGDVIKLIQEVREHPEKFSYSDADILFRFTAVSADRQEDYKEIIEKLQALLGGVIQVQFGNINEAGAFQISFDPSGIGDVAPEGTRVVYAGPLSPELLEIAEGSGVLLIPASESQGARLSLPLFQGLAFSVFVQRLGGKMVVELLQQIWRFIRADSSVDLTSENCQRIKEVPPQAALSDYLGLTLKLVAIEWEAFLDSVRTAVTQTGSAA